MAASEVAAITGLSEEASQSLLDAAGGNLEVAVQLHFDQEDSAAGSSAAARSGGGGGGEAHGGGGDPAARPPARQPPAAAAGSGAGVLDFLSYVGGLPGFSHLRLLFVGLGRLLQRTGLLSLVLPVADLLLLTPLRLLGFLAPPPRESAAEAAARFTAEFEELHGETHPRFFRGSCSEALSRARREAKFCLVYLHSAAHPAAASTCDELIANALFAAFVDENFVFWVADDATADGRAVRQALRPRELPTLVVLAQAEGAGRGRGAQALAQVAGVRLRDVDGTVAALSETLQTWAPLLEEAREELTARAVDRAIIQERAALGRPTPPRPARRTAHLPLPLPPQEQASEYERALAEDQAREEAEVAAAAAAEEAERAAAEAAEAAEAEAAGPTRCSEPCETCPRHVHGAPRRRLAQRRRRRRGGRRGWQRRTPSRRSLRRGRAPRPWRSSCRTGDG